MRLNLGCSDRKIEGFISVDIVPPADVVTDLSWKWPWETSSVDEVLAFDVCEHVRDAGSIYPGLGTTGETQNGRIFFMNELHRVLKPGAHATIETPNAARGVGFMQDPTHRQMFCLSTFKYFEHGTFAHGRLGKSYGITAAFKVIELSEHMSSGEDSRETVWKIRAVLEAVK